MPVHPNFHGVKGKSGRKCYRDEQLRIEIIEKAWLKKKKRMTDNDATQIVLKDMINKTDLTSGGKPLPLLGGQSNGDINNSDKKITETGQEDTGD